MTFDVTITSEELRVLAELTETFPEPQPRGTLLDLLIGEEVGAWLTEAFLVSQQFSDSELPPVAPAQVPVLLDLAERAREAGTFDLPAPQRGW